LQGGGAIVSRNISSKVKNFCILLKTEKSCKIGAPYLVAVSEEQKIQTGEKRTSGGGEKSTGKGQREK